MESLKDDLILFKFNKTTLFDVRKEFDLHEENAMKQVVDSFAEWISKQGHFTYTNFDRHYLETSLVHAKGSLERAKSTIDKLCTMKSLLPHFFSKHDVSKDLLDLTPFVMQATMPKLCKDNYRLYCIKMVSTDFDAATLLDFHRFSILMSEYCKANDYLMGFICVIDCLDINILSAVSKINLLDLRNAVTIMTEGYGFRVKGVHVLSPSKAIDAFIGLLKQVASPKIASRIHSHKTMDSLHQYVDKECLPKDYGGDQASIKEVNRNWLKVLSQKENVAFFKEICEAKTDERNRMTSKFNDEILGMPGSFRTLTVD